LVVAILGAGLYLIDSRVTAREQAGAVPADTQVVHAAQLIPHYHGLSITWKEVDALRAQGHARVIWFYSDNGGDYAFVFDSTPELQEWQACASKGLPVLMCS
jgi:hypothetical protein